MAGLSGSGNLSLENMQPLRTTFCSCGARRKTVVHNLHLWSDSATNVRMSASLMCMHARLTPEARSMARFRKRTLQLWGTSRVVFVEAAPPATDTVTAASGPCCRAATVSRASACSHLRRDRAMSCRQS